LGRRKEPGLAARPQGCDGSLHCPRLAAEDIVFFRAEVIEADIRGGQSGVSELPRPRRIQSVPRGEQDRRQLASADLDDRREVVPQQRLSAGQGHPACPVGAKLVGQPREAFERRVFGAP
jgi:hypothetical protein